MNPWVVSGLAVFGVAVTIAADWLVARLRHPRRRCGWPLGAITADLIWILLIVMAGVLATRYVERITCAAIGYLAFAFAVFVLSLLRAYLYQRVRDQRALEPRRDIHALLGNTVHQFGHLLFAAATYLALSLLIQGPADPMLFIPVCIGALLPDLDTPDSLIGRLVPFVSRRLKARLGHRGEWHTLGVNILVAVITAPLVVPIGLQAWALIPLGFLSHLILDMLNPQGIMLFWPLSRTRYFVFGGFVESAGSAAEVKLVAALAAATVVLVFVAKVGPAPPPPVAVPSFEDGLERYRSIRGRNLVFADVEGAWQATGRRVSARFEILNAIGQSFIMLDRYTGTVFTAGRAASDNLYLNSITVLAGSSVRIKPVEVQLDNQRLAEALPIVYQMQREPGLQYIFVSGDVVLPAPEPPLRADYAQTRLRRIQAHDAGHYSFRYLTPARLIELANVRVETADLVIVATYASPASGPTVTPLPSPPPTPKPQIPAGEGAP